MINDNSLRREDGGSTLNIYSAADISATAAEVNKKNYTEPKTNESG